MERPAKPVTSTHSSSTRMRGARRWLDRGLLALLMLISWGVATAKDGVESAWWGIDAWAGHHQFGLLGLVKAAGLHWGTSRACASARGCSPYKTHDEQNYGEQATPQAL